MEVLLKKKNKQKYRYSNHMPIMLMNINEVDVKKWKTHRSKRNTFMGLGKVELGP